MSLYLIYFIISFIAINSYQKINDLAPINLNINSELILQYTKSKFESQSFVFILLKPHINEFMFGNICIYYNNNFNEDFDCLNINIEKQETFKFNILKETNNLYIKIKGKFNGILTILNPNEINLLDIDNSYYFDNIRLDNNKYISFKIPRLINNKIINIILSNNVCDSLKIYKNKELISCIDNIDNYISLESGNEYILEYYPNISYSLTINFLDNIIIDVDSNHKSIQASNYFDFFFIKNVEKYQINEPIGLLIQSNYRFSIKGGFLIQDINRNELFDDDIFTDEIIQEQELRYFIFNKNNSDYKYFLFGIKLYSTQGESFDIKLINSIITINDIIFQYNLITNSSYLFVIDENLTNKFIDYSSDICLSYEKDTKMITFAYGDRFYQNKMVFLPLKEIEGVFFNKGENGLFSFKMLTQSMSSKLNPLYNPILFTNSRHIFNFNPLFNSYYVYFGLIAGNTKFSFIDNINNENIDYNQNYIYSNLINETKFISYNQNSQALIEIFYETEHSFNYIIRNSKLLLLRNDFNYTLNILSQKIKIKLLTDSNVQILDGDKKYELNSNNNYIKINLLNNIIQCNGNNSLINIFFPLTNETNENMQICKNKEECEFNNIEEFFIIFPNNKNFNTVNLILYLDDDSFDQITALYLIDYNEIPYSRNKYNLGNKIVLTNKKEYSLLIKNIAQNDIVKHSIEEKFFIYFSLSNKTENIKIKMQFYNEIYPDNFDLILLNKGKNKIYLGDNDISFIQIDQCKNSNNSIKYSIIRDEKIDPLEKDIIYNESEKVIICNKTEDDNYISLEINSNEDLLISKSNSEIEFLEDFIFDFEIYIDQDEEGNLTISFNSVTMFYQVEYYIIILKDNYLNNELKNNCFLHQILEKKEYILQKIIFSNGEEDNFNTTINITKTLNTQKNYTVVAFAKEIHDKYFLYRYYNPKEFEVTHEDKEEKNKILMWVLISVGIAIFIIVGIILIRFCIIKKRKKDIKIDINDPLITNE